MRTLIDLVVERPLAFLDCETTGNSTAADRIVELSLVIVYPATKNEPAPAPFTKTRRINPTIPIPAEATGIHGIRDEDVRGEPTFRDVCRDLWKLLDPCDLAGFNLRGFDLPILRAEFQRCGITFEATTRRTIDLQYLFHKREPRNLPAAVQFYLGRAHAGAHGAEADTLVLLELLEAQLGKYPDLPCDVKGLHAACDEFRPFRTAVEDWFGDDLANPVFHRGKTVMGKTLAEVIKNDAGFIQWMLVKAADMEEEVKDFVRRYRETVTFDDVPRPGPASASEKPVVQASLGV